MSSLIETENEIAAHYIGQHKQVVTSGAGVQSLIAADNSRVSLTVALAEAITPTGATNVQVGIQIGALFFPLFVLNGAMPVHTIDITRYGQLVKDAFFFLSSVDELPIDAVALVRVR